MLHIYTAKPIDFHALWSILGTAIILDAYGCHFTCTQARHPGTLRVNKILKIWFSLCKVYDMIIEVLVKIVDLLHALGCTDDDESILRTIQSNLKVSCFLFFGIFIIIYSIDYLVMDLSHRYLL